MKLRFKAVLARITNKLEPSSFHDIWNTSQREKICISDQWSQMLWRARLTYQLQRSDKHFSALTTKNFPMNQWREYDSLSKRKKQKHLATEFSLTFLSTVCTIMNFMLVCHFRELKNNGSHNSICVQNWC